VEWRRNLSRIIKERESCCFDGVIESITLENFLRQEEVYPAVFSEEDSKKIKANAEELLRVARQQAGSIIEAAEKNAEEIVSRAKEGIERSKKDGYEKGFQEGLEKAEAEAEKKYGQIFEKEIEKLKHIIELNKEAYKEAIRSAEASLVKLALDAAHKVIRREAAKDDEILLGTIREGLSRVMEKASIVMHVHPEQLNFVKENKQRVLSALDGVDSFELFEDPKVDKGGCIIETENGTIELRLGKQMQEIRKALTGEDKEDDNASNA
jgi:flagellar assembly protein FliH